MDKKKIDPGWNDPPMLNYSASNPPPKSRITNKRVAFPLSGNNAGSSPLFPGSIPKMPPTSSILTPPPVNAQAQETVSSELFKTVKENFDKALLIDHSLKNKRSIQLLFKAWEDGKLNDDCQQCIYLFSKHLVQNNKGDARQLKEKLLTEFQDVCKDWLDHFEV